MFWNHIRCNIYKIPFFNAVRKKKNETEYKMAYDRQGDKWFLLGGPIPGDRPYSISLPVFHFTWNRNGESFHIHINENHQQPK